MIEFFVSLLEEFLRIRNYHLCIALTMALQLTSVKRSFFPTPSLTLFLLSSLLLSSQSFPSLSLSHTFSLSLSFFLLLSPLSAHTHDPHSAYPLSLLPKVAGYMGRGG